MRLTDIEIGRVIAHEVVRASQFEERPPFSSDSLIELDARAKVLVAKRLIDTISSGSHCIDVTVEDSADGSPFDQATRMIDQTDHGFVIASKQLASALSSSQTAGPIKAGSAIFVQGMCLGETRRLRFIAIIKADSDQALLKRVRGEAISLTFVTDMLLGESQRLIKIAFLIEEVTFAPRGGARERHPKRSTEDFSVKVFDHLMQTSGDGTAAAYFLKTFLRCKISANSSRQTKQFYEVAKSFIDAHAASPAEKLELYGDLVSYLRGNRTILEPREFARDVLPAAQQDAFLNTCRDAGVTDAISKDLEMLKGKLRRQSVKFTSNVTLFAPTEVFQESVRIGETHDGWTDLKIKGTLETLP